MSPARSTARSLLAATLLATAVAAQMPVSTPLLVTNGPARAIDVADVNGDGRPDLVVMDALNKLSSQLGDGLGAFGAPIVQGLDGFPHVGLAAADFDGDGRADVVLTKTVDNEVDWMELRLSLGDGSFGPAASAQLDGEAGDVDALDLDLDGDADVVIGSVDNQRVNVFRGDGTGALGPKQTVSAQFFARDVAEGDMDEDGDLDLVVASNIMQNVAVVLATGAASWAAPVMHQTLVSPEDVQLGDIDADGDLDVVTGGDGAYFALLHGDGAGGLGDAQIAAIGNGVQQLALADIDEDGRQDAAFIMNGDDQAGVVFFDEPLDWWTYDRYGTGYQPSCLVLADVSGDGDVDLLIGSGGVFGSTVTRLLGDGRGNFVGSLAGVDSPMDVAFGDIDADGRPDLGSVQATNSSAHAVSTWRNVGMGAFAHRVDLKGGTTMGDPSFADLDADGDDDLVAIDYFLKIYAYLSNGDGTFQPEIALATANYQTDIATGDLDGDGFPDVVSTELVYPNAWQVCVRSGVGDGSFQQVFSTPLPADYQTLQLADVTGDGELDVVTASWAGAGELRVLPGAGDSSFGTAVSTPSFVQANALSIGDLDEDGDRDVVTTSFANNGIVTLRNDGGGAFTATALLSTFAAGQPRDLEIVDLNRDGHLDVAVSCTGTESAGHGHLAFFAGAGDFSLAQPVSNLLPRMTYGCGAADIDGDGAADLATTSTFDQVSVLLNVNGPWHQLGYGLAGTQGLPRQTGEGTLAPGAPFTIALRDARPFSNAAHVIGLTTLYANFKGGTYVPAPLLVNWPLPTNGDGDVVLAGNWPGPAAPGLSLYFQFWVQDPAGPKGWAASGGMKATLP